MLASFHRDHKEEELDRYKYIPIFRLNLAYAHFLEVLSLAGLFKYLIKLIVKFCQFI
jgi:hypothetical protein